MTVSPPRRDDLFDGERSASSGPTLPRDQLVTEVMAAFRKSKPAAERWIDEDGEQHVYQAVQEYWGAN